MCLELEVYKETGYENILANTHIHKITFCETILLETILAFAAYYFGKGHDWNPDLKYSLKDNSCIFS